MASVRVTQTSTAKSQTCWNLLADFDNMEFFNPGITKSYYMNETKEVGVGTKRHCDLVDGKNFVREEIIEWKVGEYFMVDIYETSLPVSNSSTKFGILPIATSGSTVYIEYTYTPPFGPLGGLMNILFLKNYLSKGLQTVVDGLVQKAEEREYLAKSA